MREEDGRDGMRMEWKRGRGEERGEDRSEEEKSIVYNNIIVV